jgi:hypothetical protein
VCIFLYSLSNGQLHNFLYKEIMGERQDGQVFCIDLLIRILCKLSLYFSEFYTIIDEFLKIGKISRIKRINKF